MSNREKLARHLVEHSPVNQAPWSHLSEESRVYWLTEADKILSLLAEGPARNEPEQDPSIPASAVAEQAERIQP